MTQPVLATSAKGIRGLGPQADFFTLSGDKSPGIAELISCTAVQDWDIRKGYGLSWATIVPAGEKLSKVVFRVKIWKDTQSGDWDTFAAKYLARPAPAQPGSTLPKSFGFAHDQASAPPYNVSAVVVEDVHYLGQIEPGMVAHEIQFLEWKQPLPAPPRPDQSTPPVEGGLPPAQDKLGQEQNDATQTLLSLEAQLQ